MKTLWLSLLRSLASCLLLRRISREEGELYLDRYRIRGWMPVDGKRLYRWSLYLHHIWTPDIDVPHNHPWEWAYSIVLSGGYTEEYLLPDGLVATRRRGVGSIQRINASDYHKIVRLHGETWTLFMVGPKSGSWGFHVPGRGHVEWRDRLKERGITPDY